MEAKTTIKETQGHSNISTNLNQIITIRLKIMTDHHNITTI